MGCIWDVQEEEYRSLVVTGFETDSSADPKSLVKKTVCLFTLETPGDDIYTVWQGTRVQGSWVQEKGKLVQHKLLSSGVSLHTCSLGFTGNRSRVDLQTRTEKSN